MCPLTALQKSELIALNDISFGSITEIWTYCTQWGVVWEHYRNLNLLHSTRRRLWASQKSELIALSEMSFEIITEIWTYWLNEMSLESITEGLTYFNQRYDVWEHYRNLNISHSTRCRLRALPKSELIALTISRFRALQKSELIALNEMSFEIITEIWTYWLNEMSLESITEGLTYFNQRYDVWEDYRNLNISHSTRCRLRALQKSELIALTISRLRALQKYERITLNHVSFESITEIWTYCTQRYIVWEHYSNLDLLHSTICRLGTLQKSGLIALNGM